MFSLYLSWVASFISVVATRERINGVGAGIIGLYRMQVISTIDHSSWPGINYRKSLAQTFRCRRIEL